MVWKGTPDGINAPVAYRLFGVDADSTLGLHVQEAMSGTIAQFCNAQRQLSRLAENNNWHKIGVYPYGTIEYISNHGSETVIFTPNVAAFIQPQIVPDLMYDGYICVLNVNAAPCPDVTVSLNGQQLGLCKFPNWTNDAYIFRFGKRGLSLYGEYNKNAKDYLSQNGDPGVMNEVIPPLSWKSPADGTSFKPTIRGNAFNDKGLSYKIFTDLGVGETGFLGAHVIDPFDPSAIQYAVKPNIVKVFDFTSGPTALDTPLVYPAAGSTDGDGSGKNELTFKNTVIHDDPNNQGGELYCFIEFYSTSKKALRPVMQGFTYPAELGKQFLVNDTPLYFDVWPQSWNKVIFDLSLMNSPLPQLGFYGAAPWESYVDLQMDQMAITLQPPEDAQSVPGTQPNNKDPSSWPLFPPNYTAPTALPHKDSPAPPNYGDGYWYQPPDILGIHFRQSWIGLGSLAGFWIYAGTGHEPNVQPGGGSSAQSWWIYDTEHPGVVYKGASPPNNAAIYAEAVAPVNTFYSGGGGGLSPSNAEGTGPVGYTQVF